MHRFLLLLLLSPCGLAAPPNILFIQTDDQGPWAVGVNDERAITPHMDSLFRDGAWLKNSFVTTPVCSPSRATTMCSRYASEVGIFDWIHPGSEKGLGLDPATPTFPPLLKAAGYRTALIGKWHLGTADRFHPKKFGFDSFMGHRAGGWSNGNPTLEKDGKDRKYVGLTADILGDEVDAWLRAAPRDRPFLLCWHTRAPHGAYLPVAPEDWAPYADREDIPVPSYPGLDVKKARRVTREYLASVRSVDRNLGRVLRTLRELDLERDTVVVFTSDHGYHVGHHGLQYKGNAFWILEKPVPARGPIAKNRRPNMFDDALRVPTAVRWPAGIEPGTVIDRTVSNLDWAPTLCALAGIEAPASFRGRNLLPLLRGATPDDWDDTLFAEYSMHHGSKTHMRVVRTPRHKLVRDFLTPGRDEFYDLAEDPGERTNRIAEADPDLLQALDARLHEHMERIADRARPARK